MEALISYGINVFWLLVALFVLDQIALGMESRGWIYWRRNKPKPGGAGNALQELEAALRPSARARIERVYEEMKTRDDQGDDPWRAR